MRFQSRIILLTIVVVLALAGQWTLQAHLSPVKRLPPAPPDSLDQLPLQIGDWQGRDRELNDAESEFADDHLYRDYVNSDGTQAVTVWLTFSSEGENRRHHPEICMAVAGQPEDQSVRQTLQLPGHAAGVQQYKFGTGAEAQWVFYWHYSLPVERSNDLTRLQQVYYRINKLGGNVTLEVFAPASADEPNSQATREFVALLDQAMAALLPPGSIRGSNRRPMTLIRTAK